MPDDKKLETGREQTDNNARVFNVTVNNGEPTTMLVLAEHTGFPVVLQIPLGNGVPQWSGQEVRIILTALLQEIAQVRNGGTIGPTGGGLEI